jgi:ankyrin repeat protein
VQRLLPICGGLMKKVLFFIIFLVFGFFEFRNFFNLENAIITDEKWRFNLLLRLDDHVNYRKCFSFDLCTTPLLVAIDLNKTDYVEALLKHGAKSNMPRDINSSIHHFPIHSAIAVNNKKIVNMLINHGATLDNSLYTLMSIEHTDNPYFLELFSKENNLSLTDLFCKMTFQFNNLKYMFEHDKSNNIEKDDACITDKKHTIAKERTKLFEMAWRDGFVDNDSARITQLFIDYGANVNALDDYNNTPLHIASQKAANHVVKVLLENNASTTVKNFDGYTAYELAKANKHKWVIKAFDDFQALKK